jgi:hypothetical protein
MDDDEPGSDGSAVDSTAEVPAIVECGGSAADPGSNEPPAKRPRDGFVTHDSSVVNSWRIVHQWLEEPLAGLLGQGSVRCTVCNVVLQARLSTVQGHGESKGHRMRVQTTSGRQISLHAYCGGSTDPAVIAMYERRLWAHFASVGLSPRIVDVAFDEFFNESFTHLSLRGARRVHLCRTTP